MSPVADVFHRMQRDGEDTPERPHDRSTPSPAAAFAALLLGLLDWLRLGGVARVNFRGMLTIYRFQLTRTWRTLSQSIIAPVISTSLYFIVFGSAIGPRFSEIGGIAYGAYIVPGLIMLSLATQSLSYASFAIYFPRFTGTSFELLSSPLSHLELVTSYVAAAASKSLFLATVILASAYLFVPLRIEHPVWMIAFALLAAATFGLLGFIIGLWADNFEKLQLIPLLVVAPLTFLGGSFYSIDMLPAFWRTVALFNPAVYLIGGFRWSFYGTSDVPVELCAAVDIALLALMLLWVARKVRTGCGLRN